jgi:hypothetical protein
MLTLPLRRAARVGWAVMGAAVVEGVGTVMGSGASLDSSDDYKVKLVFKCK